MLMIRKRTLCVMTVVVINSVKTLTWAFGELNLRGKLSGESYSVGPKWESGKVGFGARVT